MWLAEQAERALLGLIQEWNEREKAWSLQVEPGCNIATARKCALMLRGEIERDEDFLTGTLVGSETIDDTTVIEMRTKMREGHEWSSEDYAVIFFRLVCVLRDAEALLKEDDEEEVKVRDDTERIRTAIKNAAMLGYVVMRNRVPYDVSDPEEVLTADTSFGAGDADGATRKVCYPVFITRGGRYCLAQSIKKMRGMPVHVRGMYLSQSVVGRNIDLYHPDGWARSTKACVTETEVAGSDKDRPLNKLISTWEAADNELVDKAEIRIKPLRTILLDIKTEAASLKQLLSGWSFFDTESMKQKNAEKLSVAVLKIDEIALKVEAKKKDLGAANAELVGLTNIARGALMIVGKQRDVRIHEPFVGNLFIAYGDMMDVADRAAQSLLRLRKIAYDVKSINDPKEMVLSAKDRTRLDQLNKKMHDLKITDEPNDTNDTVDGLLEIYKDPSSLDLIQGQEAAQEASHDLNSKAYEIIHSFKSILENMKIVASSVKQILSGWHFSDPEIRKSQNTQKMSEARKQTYDIGERLNDLSDLSRLKERVDVTLNAIIHGKLVDSKNVLNHKRNMLMIYNAAHSKIKVLNAALSILSKLIAIASELEGIMKQNIVQLGNTEKGNLESLMKKIHDLGIINETKNQRAEINQNEYNRTRDELMRSLRPYADQKAVDMLLEANPKRNDRVRISDIPVSQQNYSLVAVQVSGNVFRILRFISSRGTKYEHQLQEEEKNTIGRYKQTGVYNAQNLDRAENGKKLQILKRDDKDYEECVKAAKTFLAQKQIESNIESIASTVKWRFSDESKPSTHFLDYDGERKLQLVVVPTSVIQATKAEYKGVADMRRDGIWLYGEDEKSECPKCAVCDSRQEDKGKRKSAGLIVGYDESDKDLIKGLATRFCWHPQKKCTKT